MMLRNGANICVLGGINILKMILLLPKKLLKFWCNNLYEPHLYICLVFLFIFYSKFSCG